MRSPLLGEGELPTSVTIDGEEHPIRHGFRDGIRFETLVIDRSIPEQSKLPLALDIWYGETWPDTDVGALLEAMLDFYRCGKPAAAGESDTVLFSYAHDYDDIYAAFLQVYGVDLLDPATEIHWWRFRAMLLGLPAETRFMRVIAIRDAKVMPGMSKEEKAHLRKLKRIHALPDDAVPAPVKLRTEDEYRAALEAIRAAKLEGLTM